jgi:Ubiquitin carboxyl-terminal hydrolase, family 1
METWNPIEGDSEILTNYAHALCKHDRVQLQDVYCFDDLPGIDGLKAVLLIYPLSVTVKVPETQPTQAIFIKQEIDNSCGTIALLHSLVNLELLTDLKAVKDYADLHESFACKGETQIDRVTEMHFITIVSINGQAVWLDGRRSGPISLGNTDSKCFGDLLSCKIPSILDLSATPYFSALALTIKE